MSLINSNIESKIIEGINSIINIQDIEWSGLDTNLKLKLIHHYCNCIFYKKVDNKIWNLISIPLKSSKPKKLIQAAGFSKLTNKNLFNNFQKLILDFTIEYRTKYVKNKSNIYYTYKNLPKNEQELLINSYNKIVYIFLINNQHLIDVNIFYHKLIENNIDKLINPKTNINNLLINYDSSKIILEFNSNIKIILELFINGDRLTNNISIKYDIKLINNF